MPDDKTDSKGSKPAQNRRPNKPRFSKKPNDSSRPKSKPNLVPKATSIIGKNLANLPLDEAEAILKEMIQARSVFEYDTILPSGKITTHYVDLKETLLSAQGAYLASLLILHNLRDDIQAIGGSSDKVYSLATCASQLALFRELEIDSFLVRDASQARRRGHSRWVEGPLKPGSKICIIQDEVIDGTKVIETIRRVQEEADAQIVQVISIVDRLDGAKLRLQEYGVDYTALFTMQDLVTRDSAMV